MSLMDLLGAPSMDLGLDQPLAHFGGPPVFDPGNNWSADNWLVNTVDQPPIPDFPVEGAGVRNEPNTVAAPMGAATSGGDLPTAIDIAMSYLGRPYEWGGTGQNGHSVDCSGLVYAALKGAGYNVQRYRAVDYGHMGTPVAADDARPGDLVYFDNPNTDTDHVGIYLGGGKFIEAPQPGSKVQISALRGGAQIRRVVPDQAYSSLTTQADGRYVYHAPDGGEHVAEGRAAVPSADPSIRPQADPIAQIKALDKPAPEQPVTEQPPPAAGELPSPVTSGDATSVGEVGGLSSAEAWIVQRESGGRADADNPSSTAFGLGQLLYANRAAYGRRLGFDPDTTDPGEQLAMFRLYVKERYGTAEQAQAFWQEHGWY